MATLIITEKSSQAKDLRAALGERYGRILPAEGHLLRLAEPEEVDPDWKRWTPTLLKPDGLYPTRPDSGGNKSAKLKAILSALKSVDQVILATDCDREGQLIGQEILEHARYRGVVHRALFTAQDPKTIRDAFARLKPNNDMRPLYEAAVARQQADQIFNLSLTRTATKMLMPAGVRGVIGIGRVKTPTLAIVCLRELEIRNFKPEDYFEIVVMAEAQGSGTQAAEAQMAEAQMAELGESEAGGINRFIMRHAPAPKDRIKDRAVAEGIAAAARDHRGQLTVTVEEKRQGPPKLYDLPALQKTCGQRWGWTADHTLGVAQTLYDGEGKKLITYPRAEARYLAESQIGDVPAITAALTRLRGFAHLDVSKPVIRRGKSGHFSDKALEGVSHHAVVPNVNVLGDLEQRLSRLSDDEKRLFALICRSYLAAVMPDFEYRQTNVSMPVPVNGKPVVFRAVGRIPLKSGWKAVFSSAEERDAEAEDEQTLPPLTNGQEAVLRDPRVEAKRTQAPPRYNEGTLVDAMQNAWRFVEDPALRERLKEAKGIGTPATRAEIIKGLKRQNFLDSAGKLVVPTPAGLQLFETLRAAAPTLVDPGTTALWEMRLDEVVLGQADFRSVIDGIAAEASRLIGILVGQRATSLGMSASNGPITFRKGLTVGRTRRSTTRKTTSARKAAIASDGADSPESESGATVPVKRAPRRKAATGNAPADNATTGKPRPAPKSRAVGKSKPALNGSAIPGRISEAPPHPVPTDSRRNRAPTEKMQTFARDLARRKGIELPAGCLEDFDACRRFLDSQTGG